MRGIYNSVADIRRDVFTEIARLVYEGGGYASSIEKLPFKIIPGERATYRNSIFLERAIAGEHLRLGISLPVRRMDEHSFLNDGIEEGAITKKYYDDPLVNVIKFACSVCPEKAVMVADTCQNCLARPCKRVRPKDAVSMMNGKSCIGQEKCIKYGHCMDVCSYGAINKLKHPCVRSCGMDATTSDELSRAKIDYDKYVSCGMCLVNCPFGVIVDKGQVSQTVHAMKSDKEVIVVITPVFVGQFGPTVTPERVEGALKELSFADVVEVAIGVDLCTVEEAEDFLNKVPAEQPSMAASYYPAWSVMAKKLFPDFRPYISMALTPMALTGWLIKKQKSDAKVIFVGPCATERLGASRKSVKSDVDFVLTFEEVMEMFEAKEINLPQVEADAPFEGGTVNGRGLIVSGGVVNAAKQCIQKEHPGKEALVDSAEGLKNCHTMPIMAKAGKRGSYLLGDMACPDGCVVGAGTLRPVIRSSALVKKCTNDVEEKLTFENEYLDNLDLLTRK